MSASISVAQIIKVDEGAINARIIARESKVDFRRVEAASIKMVARLSSAEGKRIFVRLFSTLQLNAHFISVIARTRLGSDDVAQVEEALRERMEKATQALNQAIDGAEALFQQHGISGPATYDSLALEIEVGIISSMGRRYLEVIGKLDQLMPLLQTLEIHEVISTRELDKQRALLKRQVRDVANSARSLATGLRRRMNAMGAVVVEGTAGQAPSSESTEDFAKQKAADDLRTEDEAQGSENEANLDGGPEIDAVVADEEESAP